MNKSVANKKKKDCCGCNACAEICPKHCIEMKEDKKGFFYPSVNSGLCVGCGLCVNVCPFEKEHDEYNYPITAYAAWNTDRNTYLRSSSGGAAFVFSKFILENNGVVYGCSSNGLDISHIRIDNIDELYRLQGSKYVQSDIRGIFSQIKIDLKKSISVLFIGTPCQVLGLKNYIKHVPENLYLIDLICHGVPSQQMLQEHFAYVLKSHSVVHLSFRKGQIFCIELKGKDGIIYSSESHKDLYYRAFLNGISYRASCYQCPFASLKRVSDMTIGDFWGLQDVTSFPLKNDEGVSLLLPLSEKGKMLIEVVKPNMYIYERSLKEATNDNEQLHHPVKETLRVRLFRVLYPILSFDKVVTICIAGYKFRSFLKIISRKIFK